MFDYSLAMSLTKAMTENSVEHEFSTVFTQTTEPVNRDEIDGSRAVYGIHDMGQGGGRTTNSIVIYPYAMSEPGSSFWMRVYGWRVIGNHPNTCVWLRILLMVARCTVGMHQGFPGRVLYETERFCANGGDIQQLYLAVMGCAKIQFEFAKDDEMTPIGMNALWARAT